MTATTPGRGFFRINVYNIFIYAFAFLIPLSQFWSIRVLIVALAYSLFSGNFKEILNAYRRAWEIVLFFLVLILGLLNSEDLSAGMKALETTFSLFAMPLIYAAGGRLSENRRQNVVKAFGAGLLIASIVCLVNALMVYSKTHDPGVFFFYDFTTIVGSQPTYMAYYLIFVISVGLYFTYYGESPLSPVLSLVLVLFFFVVLMLTGGRTGLISLLLIFAFIILKYLVEQRTWRKTLVVGAVVTMLVSMFALNDTGLNAESDYWERWPLWQSAVAANDQPLVGVGTGDYKIELNKYYRKHRLTSYADESYNAHNQYIQMYLANGIVGLFAFILLIGRPLYLSVRNQNTMAILVLFPFVIYGITEVFLGRYQGVVFLALVHQLFASDQERFIQPGPSQLTAT